jgi:hypothetical protein
MKTAILRELFKLIKKEGTIQLKVLLKVLWIQIRIHFLLIISTAAFILSIVSMSITISNYTKITKELDVLKKQYEPMKIKTDKFDKLYFEEGK